MYSRFRASLSKETLCFNNSLKLSSKIFPLALWRQSQEDGECRAPLGYVTRTCLNKKSKSMNFIKSLGYISSILAVPFYRERVFMDDMQIIILP